MKRQGLDVLADTLIKLPKTPSIPMYTYRIWKVLLLHNDSTWIKGGGKTEGYTFEDKMDLLQEEGWEVCGLIQTSPTTTHVIDSFCYVPMRKLK